MGLMSQAELARRCKVTDATVSNWLKGTRTPSYDRLGTIAAACGVSVARLMEVAAKLTSDAGLPALVERDTEVDPIAPVVEETSGSGAV